MRYLLEYLVSWSAINDAHQKMEVVSFESVLFRFIQIVQTHALHKKADYEKALEHLRVQYYNEFLYKTQSHTVESAAFVELLKSFNDKKKAHKKDYVELFSQMCSFYTGSVGGSLNGAPLLCKTHGRINEGLNDYFLNWNYDEVIKVRDAMEISNGRCVSCSKRGNVHERQIGRLMCPAGCIPLCASCTIDEELKTEYNRRMADLMLPIVDPRLEKHLVQMYTVCQLISNDDESALGQLELRLKDYGQEVSNENIRLRKQVKALQMERSDQKQVNKLMSLDNEAGRLTLQHTKREREMAEERFSQCRHAYGLLCRQKDELEYNCHHLKQNLDESIQKQWSYYNKLRSMNVQ